MTAHKTYYHILKKIIVFTFCFSLQPAFGLGQFNWLRPYDTLLIPDQYICKGFQLNTYAEFGISKATGYTPNGNPVNVLQIWNDRQDALAMLSGFPADSAIGQKNIEIDAFDNGTRGNFCVTGNLDLDWTFAFSTRYYFKENLCLAFYLPFYGMKLHNVHWQDLTQDITAEDLRVKEELTNNLCENVFTLGNGLKLEKWNRQGLGDLTMFLEFFNQFPQKRPMLKNVGVHGRVGLNFPTGKKQDEDLILAVPFGYDGAAGIFGGAGIDILIADAIELGVDVELLHLFGNTLPRRIKTDVNQTELLLLAKTCAYKDFGLVQRFNLYAQILNLFGPVSFKVGYQFFKQDDCQLSLSNCQYSNTIANTAASLNEWTMHHFDIIATYDFSYYDSDKWFNPYFSAYARLPFKGRNIALIPTVGCTFALSF